MHDIFFFTDVHGCYDLYRAAMDYCNQQDDEATIIYGGDACDRGPDGYKIMKELLDNPKVIYLKGNHEDIFFHAAMTIKHDFNREVTPDNISDYLLNNELEFYNSPVNNHLYNGGYQTLYDWMVDGMPDEIINRINKLPLTFSYENLDFCHAGGDYKTFARVNTNEYEGEPVDKDDLMMLIWDRNYLGLGWAPNRTCIFGHTPTPHLPAKYYGKDKSLTSVHPCAYYATLSDKWAGRKIDMDTGAFNTHKLYVLNCLTMEAQGFQKKESKIRKDEIIYLHD